MSSEARAKPKYIYDLPYREREELCRILDIHEKWKSLGGHMKFNTLDIQGLEHLERRGKSPSDELLTMWSSQNHTVLELFVLLSRIQHFQAMAVLKPFVEPDYHQILYEGEESLTKLLRPDDDHQTCAMNSVAASARNPSGQAASIDNKTFGGHNLNVMLPEAVKSDKKGFPGSDKIQNIRGLVSSEENGPNSQQRKEILSPPTPYSPESSQPPPILTPLALGKTGGASDLFQLSPAGIGALSVGYAAGGRTPNNPMVQQHIDMPVASSPMRKLSDGSMATFQSDYQSVLPMHDYKELEAATNGWNPANIIGKGGFGTVFKGVWKNTDVAIKRIELPKGDSRESQEVPYQQSYRELQVLQRIHHKNILQLYSFSFNGNQPCLVYQFMEKGSLEDRLQRRNGTAPLTWPQRYNIAKGTARGLQYLHTVQEKPLIHGDIKSANILLDSNFEPRIGDFGLAREGPQTQYTHMKVSRVHGTKPYLPDEFLRSKKLSTKVDTYSFGVVLFELATGLRAFDDRRSNKFLKDEVLNQKDVVQLMDLKAGQSSPVTFGTLVELGKLCVSKLPKERPEMKDVSQQLDQNTAAAQVTWTLPLELQLFYDQLGQQRRQSVSNSPQIQLSSGQPVNSVSKQPVNLSSHPANGLGMTGQPSTGVSGNAPAFGASQGFVRSDNNANIQIGQVTPSSNVAVSSRPVFTNQLSVQNQVNQMTADPENNASGKTTDGAVPAESPTFETLLPTVLPAAPQASLQSPAISVMPPTGSELSPASSHSSLSESSVSDSHDSQMGSAVGPKEGENQHDEDAPVNLPLLSVLGIEDDNLNTSPSSSNTHQSTTMPTDQ